MPESSALPAAEAGDATRSADQDAEETHGFTEAQIAEYKEQDRYLPIANVGRIMKNSLPDNAKIAKEAKECVQECVSEFISFLSSEAAEKVFTDKRKTINGEDILYAMTTLGFDNYNEAGKIYLSKYRVWQQEHHPHRTSVTNSRMGTPDIWPGQAINGTALGAAAAAASASGRSSPLTDFEAESHATGPGTKRKADDSSALGRLLPQYGEDATVHRQELDFASFGGPPDVKRRKP